jgi:hypothetical protein
MIRMPAAIQDDVHTLISGFIHDEVDPIGDWDQGKIM